MSGDLANAAALTPDAPDVRPVSGPVHGGSLRMPGLDGLRAIAVLAVMLFHLDLPWAPGGFLGVDLFFVISGFLITRLLCAEAERTGGIDLKAFYWRRAKRLLPASLLLTAAAIFAAALFAPDALDALKRDAAASLVYLTNWALIWSDASYWEQYGRPPLLKHFWSLAIEEQFYLLWAPLAVLVRPGTAWRKALLFVIAGLGAIASITMMAAGAAAIGWPESGSDPSHLYFATHTHIFPILIGAMLGLVWRPDLTLRTSRRTPRGTAWAAGLAGTALLGLLFAGVTEQTPWLYPWGFLAASLASVVLIVAATYRGSRFGRVLDAEPMRWIGERSYGIYLWHWPVINLTRPGEDLALDGTTIFILRAGLTLALAALSYRLVEQPIRKGWIERVRSEMKQPPRRNRALTRALLAGTAALAVSAAAATTVVVAPRGMIDEDGVPVLGPGEDLPDGTVPVVPAPPSAALPPASPPEAKPAPWPEGAWPFGGQAAADPAPALAPIESTRVTAIGDSVLLGASSVLTKSLPGMTIEAKVGRQAADILKIVRGLDEAGTLTDAVVLHVGTNGTVTEPQLKGMLDILATRTRVVLVNVHVPKSWMDGNNALIEKLAPLYPNVVLADWKSEAEGHPEYFVKDGVHLRPKGMRAFTETIMTDGGLVAAPPRPQPQGRTP